MKDVMDFEGKARYLSDRPPLKIQTKRNRAKAVFLSRGSPLLNWNKVRSYRGRGSTHSDGKWQGRMALSKGMTRAMVIKALWFPLLRHRKESPAPLFEVDERTHLPILEASRKRN